MFLSILSFFFFKNQISLTFLSMILAKKTIFDSWRRKKIIWTKTLMKITLERKILENDIEKNNIIIDKTSIIFDSWILTKNQCKLLWRERFLKMILAKKAISLTRHVSIACASSNNIKLWKVPKGFYFDKLIVTGVSRLIISPSHVQPKYETNI